MRTVAEMSENLQHVRSGAVTGKEQSLFSALLKLKHASSHSPDAGSCVWRAEVVSKSLEISIR